MVILDEPANGLDPAGIVEIRNLLRGLATRQGVAVFMSSHILSEVHRLATRIGIVDRGRMEKELSAAALAEQEEQRRVAEVRDPEEAGAVADAGQRGHATVEPWHMLLALLDTGGSTAPALLRAVVGRMHEVEDRTETAQVT